MSAPPSNPQPNPAEGVLRVALGFVGSIALNTVVELDIPDLLAAGPLPVSQLAQKTATNEDALFRTLRLLASLGIFTETAPRSFAHTPASATLQSNAPNSTRDLAHFMCDPFHFRVHAEFLHSVRTGQPAVEKVCGMPIFDYFATDPRESEIFNRAMVAISAQVVPAVLEAYDFSGVGVLVDVAGGHGGVICPILQKYPQMRGILTDLQRVLDGASDCMRRHGVEGRLARVACDFFKSVPEGGDAYLMKHIIHDWDDDRALTILRNIHKALGAKQGKVILLEAVITPGNEPHFAKFLDLEMLVFPGGRERTETEFRALFDRASFRLTRIVPTKSPLCVIEAVKA